ncbi:MAG: glycosyltransferase, partial [Fidelibacterota bacterium]
MPAFLYVVLWISLIIYSFTLLFFFIGLFKRKRGESEQKPLVSVVIAARNEEENLPECLNSLVHQTYPEELYEVILVDDQSTDSTPEIAQNYINRFSKL